MTHTVSRPVHVILKSDKLDYYLQGPRKTFFFVNLFSIGQGPSIAGKLNWNLLVFFSFAFVLGQCVFDCEVCHNLYYCLLLHWFI